MHRFILLFVVGSWKCIKTIIKSGNAITAFLGSFLVFFCMPFLCSCFYLFKFLVSVNCYVSFSVYFQLLEVSLLGETHKTGRLDAVFDRNVLCVNRQVLDAKYGLKRWQIGEIASKIGQLYYHY